LPAHARPQCDPLKSPLACLIRDPYGLLLLLGLFALISVAVNIGPVSAFLMSCRWGVLAVLAIAGLVVGGDCFSRRLTGAHWWLVGLIIMGGCSCIWSIDPLYSVQRLLSFVLLYIAVFIGAWSWLQRKQNLLLGAEILYLLSLVVTLISAFHLGGDDLLGRTTRATGAMGKATGAGAFAAAVIPILLWKIRYSRGLVRLVAQFALLVQGYLLFFSGARGALLLRRIAGVVVVQLPRVASIGARTWISDGCVCGHGIDRDRHAPGVRRPQGVAGHGDDAGSAIVRVARGRRQAPAARVRIRRRTVCDLL
jgi:hypothetical protein